MNHFDDIEVIPLPAEFGRVLLDDASCEAVLVESTVSGTAPDSMDPTRVGGGPRGTVTLYRVGRVYVAEVVEAEGTTRTVGLAPADAEAYVEDVGRDDEWTVLSVDGALSPDHPRADEAEAAASANSSSSRR